MLLENATLTFKQKQKLVAGKTKAKFVLKRL